jgi:hypothetical protein
MAKDYNISEIVKIPASAAGRIFYRAIHHETSSVRFSDEKPGSLALAGQYFHLASGCTCIDENLFTVDREKFMKFKTSVTSRT